MEDQQIGSYRILRKIGAGGMARVFLAVHKDVPNLKVVLKILDDPRMVERFKQEADKLALLDGNSHICQIKHFFNHGDDIVIAMEYIDGVTLEQKIEEENRLSMAESLKIISDVLGTLEFAHQKGIYHRDIKPSNIMMDGSGNSKIIDFGIAKAKTDPNLTTAGTACGTPAYMAPEQFAPTEDIDYARVDIYAVGSTLYQMLTGACPFVEDNVFALRDAKLFREPRRPRDLNSDIPKAIEEIILKSIKREPKERYQTTREMKDAIDIILKTLDVSALEKTGTVAKAKGPASRRSRMPYYLGGAAVIIIIAVFLFLKMNSRVEPPVVESKTADTLQTQNSPGSTDISTNSTPTPISAQIIASIKPYGDIYMDDALMGGKTSSLSFSADSGRHVIRIENDEAVNKILLDTVDITSSIPLHKNYNFNIAKKPPEEAVTQKPATMPAAALGSIIIGSNPRGADIFIDGELQEQQTPYTFKVRPGAHRISVRLNLGGKEISRDQNLTAIADSTVKAIFNFEN
ncbi:hypothetical protein TRIP_C20998 [Candidatus Zixiibacteriota bacterium]|nr:hypothetical protein TRIP_C20998 [candidate division Zixibacteria bacterium]